MPKGPPTVLPNPYRKQFVSYFGLQSRLLATAGMRPAETMRRSVAPHPVIAGVTRHCRRARSVVTTGEVSRS